jgi:hypothetical protein
MEVTSLPPFRGKAWPARPLRYGRRSFVLALRIVNHQSQLGLDHASDSSNATQEGNFLFSSIIAVPSLGAASTHLCPLVPERPHSVAPPQHSLFS